MDTPTEPPIETPTDIKGEITVTPHISDSYKNFLEGKNLNLLLRDCIVGKKRCGLYKQFIFYIDDNFVLKGPYKPENKKLENLKFLKDTLHRMNDLLCNLLIFPIEKLHIDSHYYVLFENIYYTDRLKHYKYTESPGFKPNYTYNIQCSDKILKFTDAWNIPKCKENILTHLNDIVVNMIFLWAYNVGNTNLSNILYDTEKNKIYIVDMDENKKYGINIDHSIENNVKLDRWFFFSRRINSKIKLELEKLIDINVVIQKLEFLIVKYDEKNIEDTNDKIFEIKKKILYAICVFKLEHFVDT